MNIQAATKDKYMRIFVQLILYLVRLYLIICEDREDICVLQSPASAARAAATHNDHFNIQGSIHAMQWAERGLKEAIHDIIETQDETAYWKVAAHLITSVVADVESDSILVMFIATLAITTPADNTFLDARRFTPLLSGLVFMLKTLWFPHTMITIERQAAAEGWHEPTDEDLICIARLRSERFEMIHDRQLGKEALWNSGINIIMGYRTFGWACAKAETVKASVRWDKDEQSLWMGPTQIHLKSVTGLMQMTIGYMRNSLKLLLEPCPLKLDIADFPLDELVDDPAWTEPGAWFGAHPSNQDKFNFDRFANRLLPVLLPINKRPGSAFRREDVDWAIVDQYLESEHSFLLWATVAIYLTSGLPPRGTELMEQTYKDAASGRGRSILLGPNSEVWLDLTYGKSDHVGPRSKFNLHILHPEVGRLYAFYLSTARQATDVLWSLKYQTDRRPYILSRRHDTENILRPWDTTTFVRHLQHACLIANMGMSFNIRDFRQFAEGVVHKKFRCGPLAEVFRKLIYDSTHPEQDHVIAGYTASEIETVSAHVSAAFQNPEPRGKGKARDTLGLYQDAYSAQSGRSLEASVLWYGRDETHRAHMSEDGIAKARMVSRGWQSFWGIIDEPQPEHSFLSLSSDTGTPSASTLSGSHISALIEAGIERTVTEIRRTLRSNPSPSTEQHNPPSTDLAMNINSPSTVNRLPMNVSQARLLLELQRGQFKYQYAGFRSHALAEAVTFMLNNTAVNLGLIAGTGVGKSQAYLLSAKTMVGSADITVLVVPYKALMLDVANQCQKRALLHDMWTGRDEVKLERGKPGLLIISLNKFVSTRFTEWLAQPANRLRILRVIFDEAHVLIDERSLRHCVDKIPRMTALLKDKRWIFMTATLPPSRQQDLLSLVHLPIHWCRELTHRKDLRFRIQRYSDKKGLLQTLGSYIHKFRYNAENHPSEETSQLMIVVKSRDQAKEFAETLKTGYYVSDKSDEHANYNGTNPNQDYLHKFIAGKVVVIIGTTALGVGVDRPRIDLVIQVDRPYSMISFAQVAGRAARTRKSVGEVIIYLKSKDSFPAFCPPIPTSDKEAVDLMLSEQVCMRVPMGSWLDGRAATCLELHAEPCDYCMLNVGYQPACPDDDDDDTLARKPSSSPHFDDSPSLGRGNPHRSEAATDPSHNNGEKRKADSVGDTSNKSRRTDDVRAPASTSTNVLASAYTLISSDLQKEVQSALEHVSTATPTKSAQMTSAQRRPDGLRASWPMDSDEETSASIRPAASGTVAIRTPRQPNPSGSRAAALRVSTPFPAAAALASSTTVPPGASESHDNGFGTFVENPEDGCYYLVPSHQTASLPTASNATTMRPPAKSTSLTPSMEAAAVGSTNRNKMRPRRARTTPDTPRIVGGPGFSANAVPDYPVFIPTVNDSLAQELRDFDIWKERIQAAVRNLEHRCAMCKLLRRPDDHPASRCQTYGLNVSAAIQFRRTKSNDWGYGQACFFCNLPQEICGRQNDARTCSLAAYKDGIRGILMLLTVYPDALEAAKEVAIYLNPRYDLEAPQKPLVLPQSWKEIEYLFNKPTYTAFQAVAAVLFLATDKV